MLIQRNTKKKNTESFVKECILKNSKYDYSLVEYKNNKKKVKIICGKHGIFEQTNEILLNQIIVNAIILNY